MNDLELELQRFITDELLDGEELDIDLDTPLLAQRIIDSLNVEELLVHVEERYGVQIEDQPPSSWGSVRMLGELIRSRIVAE